MLHNLKHNAVRTIKNAVRHIVEIGEGDSDATTSKGTGKATVSNAYSQAIGTDCYVGEVDYGQAWGTYQKIANNHCISEGSYYASNERYGEKKRAFKAELDSSNNLDEWANRSWFEWFGEIPPNPLGGYAEIYLHGSGTEQLKLNNNSALTFNIKIVGTDKNSTPNVNGYHLSGTIKRGASESTTAIVGTVTKQAWEDSTGLDARITADTTTGALKVEIYQDSANTWYWAAAGWIVEYKW